MAVTARVNLRFYSNRDVRPRPPTWGENRSQFLARFGQVKGLTRPPLCGRWPPPPSGIQFEDKCSPAALKRPPPAWTAPTRRGSKLIKIGQKLDQFLIHFFCTFEKVQKTFFEKCLFEKSWRHFWTPSTLASERLGQNWLPEGGRKLGPGTQASGPRARAWPKMDHFLVEF